MSFEEFVDAQLRPLLRIANAICGDRGLAEDVVQEVLLKAHVRWQAIAELQMPEIYVRRMLVNEYLSWRRKWSRITPHESVEPAGNAPDHADAHAQRADLREQLSQLPRQQQVVLALRYYADLSDVEIAAAMGCSPGTVRGYASRGLSTLRAMHAVDSTESAEVGRA